MPKEREHHEHIGRSRRLLSLLKAQKVLPEWVVIAAYYKAVHYVEAMFACCPIANPSHSPDHKARRGQLKKKHWQAVWKQYRPLENWSMLARYLDPSRLSAQGHQGAFDLSQDAAFQETWDRLIGNRLPKLKSAIQGVVPDSYKDIFT